MRVVRVEAVEGLDPESALDGFEWVSCGFLGLGTREVRRRIVYEGGAWWARDTGWIVNDALSFLVIDAFLRLLRWDREQL